MTVERADVKCRSHQEKRNLSGRMPVYRHEKPILSVLVPVYNHEKYLRTCINSIRMQRVNFPMEVLIAEDCSTDGSRRLLEEMEKEPGWPGSFHVFYREKNLGMRANGEDLYRRAQGKYVIVLEGDDYWLYSAKLQAQVDYLERHPDYSGCAHRTRVVGEEGKPLTMRSFIRNYPECRHRNYTLADWCLFRLPGQTATLMFRRECLFPDADSERFDSQGRTHLRCDRSDAGEMKFDYFEPTGRRFAHESGRFSFVKGYPRDQQKAFLLACQGKVYCFPEIWSAYRYHPKSGTSFSGGEKVRWELRRNFYHAAAQYLRRRLRCGGDSFCRRSSLAVGLPLLLLRDLVDWAWSPRE